MKANAWRTALRAVLVLVLTLGLYGGWVLHRESRGRPLAYLRAFATLMTAEDPIIPVNADGTEFMQRCCTTQPLFTFMSEHGWSHSDTMMSGLRFEKEGAELVVTPRILFGRFVVFELSQRL